jgi:hypothetical protein
MGQRLPIDAEAVLCNGIDEILEVGVLKHEEGVLTENEKNENVQWVACHLLATLWSHGYQLHLAKRDGGR